MDTELHFFPAFFLWGKWGGAVRSNKTPPPEEGKGLADGAAV